MPFRDRGKWRGVVKINGRRFSDSFETKREAINWENEYRKNIHASRKIISIKEFSNQYLSFAQSRYTKSTYQEKVTLSDKFIRYLGADCPVTEIMPSHIQGYLLEQAKTRTKNCANRDRKNLLAMWNWGQKILDLSLNPVAKIDRFPHDRKIQYVPPESDIFRLLAAANRKERAFLDCYLCTGARRSEIFKLKWEDVNFEKREIRLWTRKTKDGSMEGELLPMTSQLYESLRWCWQNRLFKESPFVWLCEDGPYAGQPFLFRRRFLKGLCKRAGIRSFGFHSLRRYVASVLADTHKVSAKTIQRILRHKSLQTTERYIQNLNHDLSGVMSLLDINLISSTTESTTKEKSESGIILTR
jgi:integrase